MAEKQLNSFLAAIDKIVAGKPLTPSEYERYDDEDKELLLIAQALADSGSDTGTDELDDGELDMVAGGANPRTILPEKNNKP